MSEQIDQSVKVPEDWDPIFQVSADNAEQLFSLHPREFYRYLLNSDQRCSLVTYAEIYFDLMWHFQKKVREVGREDPDDLAELTALDSFLKEHGHYLGTQYYTELERSVRVFASVAYVVLAQNPENEDVRLAVRKGIIASISNYGKPNPIELS